MSDRPTTSTTSKRNYTITLKRVDAAVIDFKLVLFSCTVTLPV